MDENSYTYPFDEEFDENDVVNRADVFTPFDDLELGPTDEETEEPIIDPSTMADIISDGENLSLRSLDFNNDDDEFFGVIKKEDIDKGKHEIEEIDTSTANENAIEEDNALMNISLADMPVINDNEEASNIDESEDKLEDEQKPEDIIAAYLQKNFHDFLAVPKISGQLLKTSDGNLIPKDAVAKTGKTVEIADSLPISKDTSHQTSVIINRDENGELESMEIVCKCGERTLIKFDYTTTQDFDNELTEIDNPNYEPIPFNELEFDNKVELIVNPELIIPQIDESAQDEMVNDDNENDTDDDEYDDIYDSLDIDDDDER